MSFRGGLTQETRVTNSYVNSLYKELSKHYNRTSDIIHYDNFKCKGKQLYYRGRDEPLTKEDGKLKAIGKLICILGKKRLIDLGFDIPKGLKPQQSVILIETEEKLPSAPDVDKANEIELQEIIESTAESTEDLIAQLKGEEMLPMRELLGLDKQLRSIGGSLKVEVAKRVQLEESIKKEKRKLEELREHPGVYNDGIREDIMKRIAKLNDKLKVRQESMDLFKGRLTNQITSFKETITKVLDKDTSLAENIRTLFREQGIMIASILTAIGMAIGLLIEVLPGGGGVTSGGPPPPKDEKGEKEWLRNKLKAWASLLGRLGMKAAEALLGIIGVIISWVLNRAADVVGWVSQNLWALVVGVGDLLYTYMVMKK